MAQDDRRWTFLVVPHTDGGAGTKSFEVSQTRLRWAVAGLAALLLLMTAVLLSWGMLASRAARIPALTAKLEQFESEREHVAQLAESLARLEEQYGQVRGMLGAEPEGNGNRMRLPIIGEVAAPSDSGTIIEAASDGRPTSWPLSRPAFITRELLSRDPGEHTGLDIAVAVGSPIHAAGAGMVIAAGQDSVYGNFVRLRHEDGYETMYAHASKILVQPAEHVERRQVVALSGNSGRSTAPHLHFEIRRNGRAIDPRTLVRPPS